MVRNKLTDQDQEQLVTLYRESEVTTTALAEQFQVSPSTVTRILKDNIPPAEYQSLVNRRRSAGRRKDSIPAEEMDQLDVMSLDPVSLPSQSVEDGEEPEVDPHPATPDSLNWRPVAAPEPRVVPAPVREVVDPGMDYEVLADELDEEDNLEFSDEDESASDLEDYDESELDTSPDPEANLQQEALQAFSILPLEDLDPPDVCFVVVDRFKELTTRPLKDFIPEGSSYLDQSGLSEELAEQARTLPIFDNHRVARRFSDMCRRSGGPPHSVIRFPGYLIEVVQAQLHDKGITHLLVDGQVYSLNY
ncbi:MAG: winged helix-turn-helix transcriptional regulator [Synechococcaceae cyanobacterium SM2_3_1]|nr:winged helix-turn-helix transcriptional regulator [Synechococcaceae cyanobacterium SM2_3_1]